MAEKPPPDEPLEEPVIVVGIPGPWSSLEELCLILRSNPRGWHLENSVLMHQQTGTRFELELYDHDPNLREAFVAAGAGRLSDPVLDAVASHIRTVYVLAFDRGKAIVGKLIDACAALLDAGGHAIKIESSGLAHAPETWLELAESSLKDYLMVDHFVVYVGDAEEMSSCGMHSFALPDSTASRSLDEDIQATLTEFNRYVMRESPEIQDKQTFGLSDEGPVFKLSLEQYTLYPAGDMFHNPFGAWRLQRALP